MQNISQAEREQALIRLVERYEAELLRMCCAYLGDASLAQDGVSQGYERQRPLTHAQESFAFTVELER